MYKQEKRTLVDSLQKTLADKTCGLVLSHKKITFSQITKARKMSQNGTKILKMKNKIAQKALENSIFKEMSLNLKQENLFVFGKDFFEVSKIAKELEKTVTEVKIVAAASEESAQHQLSFIQELAALGSKENLQSKLLNVINEVVRKTLRVIDAKCEKQKESKEV